MGSERTRPPVSMISRVPRKRMLRLSVSVLPCSARGHQYRSVFRALTRLSRSAIRYTVGEDSGTKVAV
jgi:hypothetical protein